MAAGADPFPDVLSAGSVHGVAVVASMQVAVSAARGAVVAPHQGPRPTSVFLLQGDEDAVLGTGIRHATDRGPQGLLMTRQFSIGLPRRSWRSVLHPDSRLYAWTVFVGPR